MNRLAPSLSSTPSRGTPRPVSASWRSFFFLALALVLPFGGLACDPSNAAIIELEIEDSSLLADLQNQANSVTITLFFKNQVSGFSLPTASNDGYAVFTQEPCQADTPKAPQCYLVVTANPSHVKSMLQHKRFFLLPPTLLPPDQAKQLSYTRLRVAFNLVIEKGGQVESLKNLASFDREGDIEFGKNSPVKVLLNKTTP